MDVREVESKLQEFDPVEGSENWDYWSDSGEAWSFIPENPEYHEYTNYRNELVRYPRSETRSKVAVPDLGVVSLAEDFGGEGQGDMYYIVLRIDMEEGVRYFKVDGYYSSYAGGELDGPLFEVKPVEKTITVYEKVR